MEPEDAEVVVERTKPAWPKAWGPRPDEALFSEVTQFLDEDPNSDEPEPKRVTA